MKIHYRDFDVDKIFIDEGSYDPKDEQAVTDGVVAALDYINNRIVDDGIIGLRNIDPIGWFNAAAQDAANEVAKTCGYRIVISARTLEEDSGLAPKKLYIQSINRV